MKKTLLLLFFLVWSYPGVLIYQIIAGSFVGWLVATIAGTDAGDYSTGLLGAAGFVVVGFLVYLTCRPTSTPR